MLTYRQRQLRKRYVRVVKRGKLWTTYLAIAGEGYIQAFSVMEDEPRRLALYAARMLAKALDRLLKMEANPSGAKATEGDRIGAERKGGTHRMAPATIKTNRRDTGHGHNSVRH